MRACEASALCRRWTHQVGRPPISAPAHPAWPRLEGCAPLGGLQPGWPQLAAGYKQAPTAASLTPPQGAPAPLPAHRSHPVLGPRLPAPAHALLQLPGPAHRRAWPAQPCPQRHVCAAVAAAARSGGRLPRRAHACGRGRGGHGVLEGASAPGVVGVLVALRCAVLRCTPAACLAAARPSTTKANSSAAESCCSPRTPCHTAHAWQSNPEVRQWVKEQGWGSDFTRAEDYFEAQVPAWAPVTSSLCTVPCPAPNCTRLACAVDKADLRCVSRHLAFDAACRAQLLRARRCCLQVLRLASAAGKSCIVWEELFTDGAKLRNDTLVQVGQARGAVVAFIRGAFSSAVQRALPLGLYLRCCQHLPSHSLAHVQVWKWWADAQPATGESPSLARRLLSSAWALTGRAQHALFGGVRQPWPEEWAEGVQSQPAWAATLQRVTSAVGGSLPAYGQFCAEPAGPRSNSVGAALWAPGPQPL